ncbi:RNF213 [Mytilus edulis]|uniref:RNF213 n=1 Tax=Mytilus edulis TaxID=6550 RepID=A0A8S3S1H5_MYTED|nr:RNF213 [Mytilus edulis]
MLLKEWLLLNKVSCVSLHYFILMSEIADKAGLLALLHRLAFEPGSVLCGRPVGGGNCFECGEKIGGKGYNVLTDGNFIDKGEDFTQTGHILGRVAHLNLVYSPCRKLSKASSAILRLLTHMSMYIGTNYNKQAICQSIKPKIMTGDVLKFVIEHINFDLTSVQNILGINRDDAVLFMHHLLVHVMNRRNAETLIPDTFRLLSKQSRSDWEEEVAKRYIEPVLQNVKSSIVACNQEILNDKRLGKYFSNNSTLNTPKQMGSDGLMQILYETDKPQENHDIQNLHTVPVMWRYREHITVNHLKQNLEGTERTMPVPVLRLFLKEDYHLRAIRFIPSIMRLQKMLIQKYGRKLDRTEITVLTIHDVKQDFKKHLLLIIHINKNCFISQDRQYEEFEQLLKDFEMAWMCVKDMLRNFVCPVNGHLVVIDEAYLRSDIADDATDVSTHSLSTVHVKDISPAHLISYHPDKDILPMLYSNCNYTFEVGQGTIIEYNFTNLERQLVDRFLFSKSTITGLEEIEIITYRSESTNAVVFVELCEKMKQERLNPAVRSQICGELHMRNLPELCDSLDNLDLCISFLKSIGSNLNMSLSYFMENTLKIDTPLISTKARNASKCKHAMSLWISFALERAKQLAKYDREDLPAEQINTLLELIFECIVFKIDVPQNINDEDYIDISQISFRDQLIGYIDTSPFEEDLQIDDSLMVVIGQIPSDMDDQLRILTAQSVDFWNEVNKCRQRKIR